MKRFADITSLLLHPLLITTYVFGIILFEYPYLNIPNVEYKYILLALVFVCTFLIPSLMIFSLKKTNIISSVRLENRKERPIPFLLTIGVYIYTYFLLRNQSYYDQLFSNIIIVITISLLAVLLITFFWKISAHTIGMGGLTGLILWIHFTSPCYHNTLIILALLGTASVMSARLYLKAHTSSQVYFGYLLGLVISMGFYSWLGG